jgi:uncharacterized protein (TIGR02266 family)
MSSPKPPTERRTAERLDVELWVEESTDRELYFQRCSNLSTGGLFLERTIPHPKGTVVSLKFSLPDDSKSFVVRGEIVNVGEAASDLGMGVKFIDLTDELRDRIDRFIKKASQKKA